MRYRSAATRGLREKAVWRTGREVVLVRCPSCGIELNPAEATCLGCGADQPRCCDVCRTLNPSSANYCCHCGRRLIPSAATSAAVLPMAMPPHISERVLRSRGAFEGERRHVTVLFADIRGSLGVIGGGDPEEAQTLLDAVLSEMIAAVHRYEGTVNQLLGDGIMALFGAPIAQEDHAVRAASAALSMQQAVARLHDASWTDRGVSPQIRVGLNSGEVLIQTVRNDLSIEYRAVGSTTHMAARMEQLATPGRVWVTADTVRVGRGLLRTHPVGTVEVKGVAEPVEAFELTGVTVRTRFEATDRRGLSALTGRDEALAVLETALRDALAGRARAVVLSGEPGVGKSRLCYELLRTPSADGCRLLETSALSYGGTTPHGVLARLLRLLLRVEDTDDASHIAEKARELARECGDAPEQRVLVALELLGVPSGDRSWTRLDPVQRRRRIEETLRELIAAWCARGPCVLLFEDLHWCDAESLAFIATLLQTPPAAHVLLLATHRKEFEPAWPAPPEALTYQRLETLDAQAAEALLAALIGADAALAPLRRTLAERTGGNPFFLEECARSLTERGVLTRDAAPGVQVRESEPFDVPATIEALIGARLDRLPAEVLEVLQAAAVIGDESSVELLLRVTELDATVLDQRLSLLVQADLMYRTGDLQAPLYRLKHALIRDVAYRRLLRASRRSLHARVVAAYEALYAARIAEHVERLAEHSARAELWAKAAGYHQHACVRAASRSANAQAITHIERGLSALSHVAPGPARDRTAVDLRLLALAPLVPHGDAERMIALLREAEVHAQSLGDARRLAAISSQLATGLWMVGRHDEAMRQAEHAIDLAVRMGDDAAGFQENARYNVAMIHHARGELLPSISILRELVLHFSGVDARQRPIHWSGYPAVFVRTFAVSTLSLLGGFEEADRLFREGRAIADEFDHPHSRTMILEEYGFCLLVKGEPEAARDVLTLAMAVCERDEVRAMHAPIAARLGVALVECGDVEAGRAIIEDAMARETYRQAAHYGLDYLLIGLAEARLRAGDLAGALQSARRAESITAEAGEQAYHVCALVQLGAVLAAHAERGDEALEVYTCALADAQRLGMRPFQAFAHQGRAALELGRGDAEAKDRALDAAAAIWRAQVTALREVGTSPAVASLEQA